MPPSKAEQAPGSDLRLGVVLYCMDFGECCQVSWGMDRALSWADDTTLRLWDLKETGACRISSRGLVTSRAHPLLANCIQAQVHFEKSV